MIVHTMKLTSSIASSQRPRARRSGSAVSSGRGERSAHVSTSSCLSSWIPADAMHGLLLEHRAQEVALTHLNLLVMLVQLPGDDCGDTVSVGGLRWPGKLIYRCVSSWTNLLSSPTPPAVHNRPSSFHAFVQQQDACFSTDRAAASRLQLFRPHMRLPLPSSAVQNV